MDRPYQIMEHLRTVEHIEAGRIGLKFMGPELADSLAQDGVIEITLLSGGTSK